VSGIRRPSRRDFLKLAGLGYGGLQAINLGKLQSEPPVWEQFSAGERLGRVIGGRVPVYSRPDTESQVVATLYDDAVVPWLRETVGRRPLWFSQRFVETPEGYIYSPNLQPVRNLPNQPLSEIEGAGMWMEVSVPYVDFSLANPPARSPWLQNGSWPRLYYSQVMWAGGMRTGENGQVYYQVMERYGTFGDLFWVPAEAMRPITAEEVTPIRPEVDPESKRVVVNLARQELSCFEGQEEIYACRVSTGGKWDKDGNPSDKWITPVGTLTIWRKLVSVHMTGGTTGGGYDLPGIGWTALFSGNGVAIHSTFWHNSFGIPKSHGCVNAAPEDAKWVWRWTQPAVEYDPGDIIISIKGSTKVTVKEE
jgi:lipoprotein-anchoring transpeptidase ErfK/SrfK